MGAGAHRVYAISLFELTSSTLGISPSFEGRWKDIESLMYKNTQFAIVR